MSNLQVFNTLTGKKETFTPIEPGKVRIYACGPTVYDNCHIGHARMAIVWDVIPRYLRFLGFDVTFVRNITDVDDKIIKRAPSLNMRPDQLAREFTYAFWRDVRALDIAQPDFEPRATEYIAAMIKFIQDSIDSGHAYASDGDVYFDVSSFKDYGKLKKQNLEDMMSGARELAISQNDLLERKKNPVDFALWKRANPDEHGWQSPWGFGRPGWHLECSTMIQQLLGETIDIHGGGDDLIFPHHENEIAQSEALHGKPLARYWVHNGMVTTGAEKMSKSLGNFRTVQELLQAYSADTIRLFILQTHYRSPLEFSIEAIEAVKTGLSRLVRAANLGSTNNSANASATGANNGHESADGAVHQSVGQTVEKTVGQTVAETDAQFREAMDNDFNTAAAIAVLYGIADKIFQENREPQRNTLVETLKKYAAVLGLSLADTTQEMESDTATKLVDLVLTLRQEARSRKDFKTSDLIRDQLANIGIKVMDTTGGGVTWEKC